MVDAQDEVMALFRDGAEGAAYAVPISVVQQHIATDEQAAAFITAIGNVEGFSLPAGTPVHLLTAEVIEPYRVTDAQWQTLLAQTGGVSVDDVAGHPDIGRFPPTITVRTPAHQGILLAFNLPSLPISPQQAGDPNLSRDAN